MSLDRLAAAGDPQLRRILLFARGRPEPFTAAEAAAAVGGHRTAARYRLERLVATGFLSVTLERRSGRRGPGAGRPAKVYRVAPELEGVEFPNRRYAELLGLLVEKIPPRAREQALREAGAEFGHALATAARVQGSRDARTGVERVCEGLGSLGFQVSLHGFEDGRAILDTPTCPLRPLVVGQPAAGEIDLGMWAGLIEHGVQGIASVSVERDRAHCLSEHRSCRILATLGRQEPESSDVTASR